VEREAVEEKTEPERSPCAKNGMIVSIMIHFALLISHASFIHFICRLPTYKAVALSRSLKPFLRQLGDELDAPRNGLLRLREPEIA
jgi:hypothetical protein